HLRGSRFGPVDAAAEPRGDAAADKRGGLERRVRGDLDQGRLASHQGLGERAELGHAVHGLAVEGVAPGAVADHGTGQRADAEVTEVLATRGAPEARATGR